MLFQLPERSGPCAALGIISLCLVAVLASGCDPGPSPPESSPSSATPAANLRALVGVDAVERTLGERTPTGRGIAFGHVEGSIDSAYLPRTDSPAFTGVDFQRRSAAARVSGHADATARLIYGQGGLAPGVSRVNLYSAAEWMGPRGLRLGSETPPTPDGCRVFTHSWMSGQSPVDDAVLARLDQLIDKEDVIVVVGVNNGGNSAVPPLLASAYNAIAVGTTGQSSSTGYTLAAQAGRCKPELVADLPRTSFAGPVVAAVAGRLLEMSDRMAAEAKGPGAHYVKNARRAEVIKAVLLAGADGSRGFAPQEGHPLDPHHGAGEVRFDRSLQALMNGPIAPSEPGSPPLKTAQPRGWDFAIVPNDQPVAYEFEVTQPLKEWTIAVVWHRRVAFTVREHPTTKKRLVNYGTRTADIDLNLLHIGQGQTDILARSRSTQDNLELIRRHDVKPGVYRIDVRHKPLAEPEKWDVAVAWWSQ